MPLEHSNDPSVPTPSVAAWPPTISIVDVLFDVLFLQTATDRNDTARQLWCYQQWRRVLFSDESQFCISTVVGRVRVWRRFESYADMWWRETHGVGKSIMVWGAIGMNHKDGPVIFQNIGPCRGNGVTALRYINRVLRLHILPYFGRFSRIMPAPTLPESPGSFSSSTTSKIMPWPDLSSHLHPHLRWLSFPAFATDSDRLVTNSR